MILVGAQGEMYRLIGHINEPLKREEAVELSARLAVMVGDVNCDEVKAHIQKLLKEVA